MLGRGEVEYPLPMVPTALRKLGHKVTGRIEGDGGVGKPAPIECLPPITQISVADQNVYVLTKDGEVWGWGDQGGLGKRGHEKAKIPERITGLKNICQISSSLKGMACYALDENKRIWSSPVEIKGLSNIESFFIGEHVYIARNKYGETYALGYGCIDMLGFDSNDYNP